MYNNTYKNILVSNENHNIRSEIIIGVIMKKEKFINFFINRRKELGYSQSKIACEMGISDQAVSNWERGISFPDLIYLDDIAKLLQTNVDSLINGKNKKIILKDNISFDNYRFSQYLSKLRKSKQLTQNDLGKLLGVPGQNISKFENGAFLPSIELLEKYAKVFKVSLLNLYYGLDDNDLYEVKQKNNTLKIIYVTGIVGVLSVLTFIMFNLLVVTYTVRIILNDETILTYQIKDNEEIELPQLPTKKGYESSWDNTDTLITSDTTYKVIYTPKEYTITYRFESDVLEEYVQTVKYGEEFELYNPNYENFTGYIYQDNIFNETVYNYDYDIIVIGKCNKEYKVTLIFDDNNTKVIYALENTNITLPQLPTKKGYESSWDNTDTLITSDTTYKVIYTPKEYTITYRFESDVLEEYVQTVKYGEEFELYNPNYENFTGYIYQDNIFNDTVYKYDYDITVLGVFLDEVYNIYREFRDTKVIMYDVGYHSSFSLNNVSLSEYLNKCPFVPGEYKNYKIIAWKDQEGNVYEVGKTYIYNFKKDLILCPIFAYYGDAFEVTISNEEAQIIKYNIPKITYLIIPDYIVIDNNQYKVTGIVEKTFQDIYFREISFSSNITRIVKNTFSYDDPKDNITSVGNIFYRGTLQQWFNIDFEEFIVSNNSKLSMQLTTSEFLTGDFYYMNSLNIPEGVEVIKPYALAFFCGNEVIIPNSLHTIEEYAFIYSHDVNITNLENVENVHPNAFLQ